MWDVWFLGQIVYLVYSNIEHPSMTSVVEYQLILFLEMEEYRTDKNGPIITKYVKRFKKLRNQKMSILKIVLLHVSFV